MNAPLICNRWFLHQIGLVATMEDENAPSSSNRRKIDSMVRDLDSIVRLLQQASLDQIQLDIIEIQKRIDGMEEKLDSPTGSLNE
ncbi:MAG: hypothetical protein CMB72_03220 [Euryarchaeota archaeon]|nr:hypothetical protein [Euryarchaeota archaeon]